MIWARLLPTVGCSLPGMVKPNDLSRYVISWSSSGVTKRTAGPQLLGHPSSVYSLAKALFAGSIRLTLGVSPQLQSLNASVPLGAPSASISVLSRKYVGSIQ